MAGNFYIFLELAKYTQSMRMCCTARMLWQCRHPGIACRFSNKNLWVRSICPFLNLFRTLISLLLKNVIDLPFQRLVKENKIYLKLEDYLASALFYSVKIVKLLPECVYNTFFKTNRIAISSVV